MAFRTAVFSRSPWLRNVDRFVTPSSSETLACARNAIHFINASLQSGNSIGVLASGI